MGSDEVLELLKAGKSPVGKYFIRHVDAPEDLEELLGTAARVPAALKARKVLPDFIKRHAVAPVIGTRGTK
jgi:hypothetical protein